MAMRGEGAPGWKSEYRIPQHLKLELDAGCVLVLDGDPGLKNEWPVYDANRTSPGKRPSERLVSRETE
ncbi:MAG: hypothetical protein KDN20_14650 [Verrucomicrobiae bacterium]|nr:hypothetical protein [Verrucomicrobiae bacterium]